MNIQSNQIIGEVVAKDYRTAAVFNKYGIDFCCQGNRTIGNACESKQIASEQIVEELSSITQTQSNDTTNFKSWPIDLLADYIEKKHHRYVKDKTLEIKPYLNKICQVHGKNHPELYEIKTLFFEAADHLASHMQKEETILFPYVRNIMLSKIDGSDFIKPPFGEISNPIKVMMAEHLNEGARFEKISVLSNKYTPPADACNTYRVTFALLNEFEQDLHLHIHLENNILFPKAIEIENEQASTQSNMCSI